MLPIDSAHSVLLLTFVEAVDSNFGLTELFVPNDYKGKPFIWYYDQLIISLICAYTPEVKI